MPKEGNAALVREHNALKRRVDQLQDDLASFGEKLSREDDPPVEPKVKKPKKKGDPPADPDEDEPEDDDRD